MDCRRAGNLELNRAHGVVVILEGDFLWRAWYNVEGIPSAFADLADHCTMINDRTMESKTIYTHRDQWGHSIQTKQDIVVNTQCL